jgi:hypothetical protein
MPLVLINGIQASAQVPRRAMLTIWQIRRSGLAALPVGR